VQYKRKDKTLEEYRQYLVGGITVGTPEKVLQGIKKYMGIGDTHFILHFIGLDEKILRLFDTKVIQAVDCLSCRKDYVFDLFVILSVFFIEETCHMTFVHYMTYSGNIGSAIKDNIYYIYTLLQILYCR